MAMDRQKLRDAALVLPVFGLILFMPPFVGLFGGADATGGVPAIALYLFGVWAVLIALSALLSRRLGRAERRSAEAETSAVEEAGDADR